ncbi:MAG: hypothetical protein FJ359_01385 [Thaumarchaeota archaeon]|nr:hypothetical protein [Nitrososphaerota archaeon]
MIWPGMGDPAKRKQTLRFLAITAGIAIAVGVGSSIVQSQISVSDPLKNCINTRDTPYKISATLELYVDGQKADIPANIGFEEGCQKSLYTITNDGTVYAEWETEYPFEIGHFLWVWDFPLRDMDQSKSRVLVNGVESSDFIHALFVDGYHYKAEFTSKAYDESKDTDFLPPEN